MSDTPKIDMAARRIGAAAARWQSGEINAVAFADAVDRFADAVAELERENAALRAALDAQMKYQRDLRADRDRLDWLTSFHGSGWLRLYLDMNDTLTRNEIDRRLFTEAPDAYWRNKQKQP